MKYLVLMFVLLMASGCTFSQQSLDDDPVIEIDNGGVNNDYPVATNLIIETDNSVFLK